MTRIREFVISSSNARYAKRARLLFTDCTRTASEGRGIQKGNAYNARARIFEGLTREGEERLSTSSTRMTVLSRSPMRSRDNTRTSFPREDAIVRARIQFFNLNSARRSNSAAFSGFLHSVICELSATAPGFPPEGGKENACLARAESNVRGKRCSLGRAQSVQDVVNNRRTSEWLRIAGRQIHIYGDL
jgi:hypothetical protein